MKNGQLHPIQFSILATLRRVRSASYSALMRPTGMLSDAFKFHIRKLVKLGLIVKEATGEYSLSSTGKEFANKLNDADLSMRYQPKLSILIIAERETKEDEQVFLFQKRLRQPFYDFWGLVGGPVLWTESIEDSAARELTKQTGLQATFTIKSFWRKRDYDRRSGASLEDKLFAILEAADITGKLSNEWTGGLNHWMTLPEFQSQPERFAETIEMIELTQKGIPYNEFIARYTDEQY